MREIRATERQASFLKKNMVPIQYVVVTGSIHFQLMLIPLTYHMIAKNKTDLIFSTVAFDFY